MMTRTSRTEEQIIGTLKAHKAGAKCADLCRRQDKSGWTFQAWMAKYSGMAVSEDNGGQSAKLFPYFASD